MAVMAVKWRVKKEKTTNSLEMYQNFIDMRQIPLKLEKSDIALIADDVVKVGENTVFCFEVTSSLAGLGYILVRNILPLFGPYSIVDEGEVRFPMREEGMYGVFTDLPFSEYQKEFGCEDAPFLAPLIEKDDGRLYIKARKDGQEVELDVAQMVAEAHIPNPDPDRLKYVRHKDGNLQNNCKENLEWSETKE